MQLAQYKKERGTIPALHTTPDQTLPHLTQANITRPHHASPLPQSHKGVFLFMATVTGCLEISGVVGSTIGKLQNVMAMSFFIAELVFTVLADSLVTLIDKLLKRSPQIERQSFVPIESQPWKFWNCEINSHTLPHLTSPSITGHHQASPDITGPDLSIPQTEPHLTLPYRTLHHLTRQHQTAPTHTTKSNHTIPHLTKPYQTRLHRTSPAHTTRLLHKFKLSDHKSPELGTKVTDSSGSASQLQDFINNVMGNLVIQYGNLKIQLPASLKAGPDLNNPRPLNNHGPNVKIKPLISIGIQILRGLDSVKDYIRGNKNIALEQILIGLTPCALDFIPTSSLNHRPIKMGSWLVNVTLRSDVQEFTPHLGIVLLPCFDLPALAQGFKVGQWESVLQERGNTLNGNVNRVHSYFFLSLANRAKYSSIARRICSERLSPFKAFRASLCFSVMYKFILIIQILYTHCMYKANVSGEAV